MMRSALLAIAVLAVLHILAAAGLVGWLAATGRLSSERLTEVKQTFGPTVAEEQEREQQAAALAEQTRREAERQAQLTGGTASTAEKLEAEQRRNELILRQLERTRQEIQSLTTNLHLARRHMEEQREQLLASREELEQRLEAIESRLNDEGFKKTVSLYETIPPRQAKQMFVDLMGAGETDQVVAYLEAMEPRKAAGVLREFKEPQDITLAVTLTERLRARGSSLVDQVEETG